MPFEVKKVGDSGDFNELIKRRTPTVSEKVGNVFVPKNKRVRLDSPGDVNRKKGIVVGKIRTKGKERGDIVKGVATAAGAAGVGVAAKETIKKFKGGKVYSNSVRKPKSL